jgi:hypothetical protein
MLFIFLKLLFLLIVSIFLYKDYQHNIEPLNNNGDDLFN